MLKNQFPKFCKRLYIILYFICFHLRKFTIIKDENSSVSFDNFPQTVVLSKYQSALKMCDRMTRIVIDKRPNCAKILETHICCALNENEFEFKEQLINVLSSEVENKNFLIYYIILSNFIEMKFKDNEISNYAIILEFIIEKMKALPQNIPLFFDTLCEYTNQYLRESEENLNIILLQKVFDLIMSSMESHPNNQQIQTKALSLISYDLRFRKSIFNVNKCIQLSMNLLLNSKDEDINRMSVQICSKFIKKTSISSRSQLFSNPIYIEKLIEIVNNAIHESNHKTFLMEQILSILESVTDLSPNICEIFVEKGGIDLCLNILKVRLNLSKRLKDSKNHLLKTFNHDLIILDIGRSI
jgi:hypothetical protein